MAEDELIRVDCALGNKITEALKLRGLQVMEVTIELVGSQIVTAQVRIALTLEQAAGVFAELMEDPRNRR